MNWRAPRQSGTHRAEPAVRVSRVRKQRLRLFLRGCPQEQRRRPNARPRRLQYFMQQVVYACAHASSLATRRAGGGRRRRDGERPPGAYARQHAEDPPAAGLLRSQRRPAVETLDSVLATL